MITAKNRDISLPEPSTFSSILNRASTLLHLKMRRRRLRDDQQHNTREHEMAAQRASGYCGVWRKAVWLNKFLVGLVLGFYWHGFLSLRRKRLACLAPVRRRLKAVAPRSGADAGNGLDRQPPARRPKIIFAPILFLYC